MGSTDNPQRRSACLLYQSDAIATGPATREARGGTGGPVVSIRSGVSVATRLM